MLFVPVLLLCVTSVPVYFGLIASWILVAEAQTPCLNFIGDLNTIGAGLSSIDMAYPALLHKQYGYEVHNTSISGASIGTFFNIIVKSRYTDNPNRPSCDNWVMLGTNDIYNNNIEWGTKSKYNFYYTNVIAMAMFLAIDGHCIQYYSGGQFLPGWCGARGSENSTTSGALYSVYPGGADTTDFVSGVSLAGTCLSCGTNCNLTFWNVSAKYLIFTIFDQAGLTSISSNINVTVMNLVNRTTWYTVITPWSPITDNTTVMSQMLYIFDLGSPPWEFNVTIRPGTGSGTWCIGYYQYYTPGDLSNVVKLMPPAYSYATTQSFDTYTMITQIYKDTSTYLSGFSIPIQYVPGVGVMDENAWSSTSAFQLSCDGHAGLAYAIAKSYSSEVLMATSNCVGLFGEDWSISGKERNRLMHSMNGNVNPATATNKAFRGRGRGRGRGRRRGKGRRRGGGRGRMMGPMTEAQFNAHTKRRDKAASRKIDRQGKAYAAKNAALAKKMAEAAKDTSTEDKVAKQWCKIMKDPMTSGNAKLGDCSVPSSNGFLSARKLNYGYQPDVTAPYQLYLITCSDAVANAEGVTGNQGLTIWGWRSTESTAPEFMETIGYENSEFLKSFTGASRPLGIKFTIRVQMPSTATPGEVYAGSIPTDGGFAELSAYINSLSAQAVQSLPDITRITGNAVAAPWRPMDDNNLKFTESNFSYDPTINPQLLPGGQYAVVVLSGWPWRVGTADPATAANFDIEAGAKYELIPVREAAALVPPTYEAPKSTHDLPAIWSKVVSRLGSVASTAIKESSMAAMDTAGGMLGGLFGMASSHGLKGSKLLAAYRAPRKRMLTTIYKNLGAPGFHPVSGFNMSHGYSRYLHNTDPSVGEKDMVSIMPPIQHITSSMSLAPQDPAPKQTTLPVAQSTPQMLAASEPPTPNGAYVKVGRGMWG